MHHPSSRLGRGSLGLALLIAALTPACIDDPNAPRDDDDGGGSGNGGNGGSGEVPSICTEPTGEPIVHTGAITASETWGADALHIVQGIFQIRGGSTLTLAPCAQIRMGVGAGFEVRGDSNAIVAAGEANARVRIFAEDPAAGWANVRVLPPSTLSFAYTTIENGGHEPLNNSMRAVIEVYGDIYQPVQPALHVDHVEIVAPDVIGVGLTENAGFTADSTALEITGAGAYPVRVWPTAITNIPDGNYTGNARDEIVIVGRPLGVDATLRNRGVRYLVGDELSGSTLSVAADVGLATLTIEAGVELAFKANGILQLENFTGEFPASGALVAVGTPDAPIRFTSADSTTPGAWVGLYFGGTPAPNNRLEHAVIEYAGGVNGTQGFNCNSVQNGRDQAAVIILGVPSGAFVQSTHIAHSAGFGVDRGWDGPEIDFITPNTFEDVAWCVQSAPHDDNHGCPVPNPACVTAD